MGGEVRVVVSSTGKRWRFPRDLGRYLGLSRRNDCGCEYGHFGCAAWAGGPCSNELLSQYEKVEED